MSLICICGRSTIYVFCTLMSTSHLMFDALHDIMLSLFMLMSY